MKRFSRTKVSMVVMRLHHNGLVKMETFFLFNYQVTGTVGNTAILSSTGIVVKMDTLFGGEMLKFNGFQIGSKYSPIKTTKLKQLHWNPAGVTCVRKQRLCILSSVWGPHSGWDQGWQLLLLCASARFRSLGDGMGQDEGRESKTVWTEKQELVQSSSRAYFKSTHNHSHQIPFLNLPQSLHDHRPHSHFSP